MSSGAERRLKILAFNANTDELAKTATIAELDDAGDFREERIVLPDTDVLAGVVAGAALAD